MKEEPKYFQVQSVDNFFSKPEEVIKFANSLEYKNNCNQKLKKNSVLILNNFLLSPALRNIQKEAHQLHSKAFYCSQKHTVLLNKKNSKLEDSDPCNIEVTSDKGCVPNDLISPNSDLSIIPILILIQILNLLKPSKSRLG